MKSAIIALTSLLMLSACGGEKINRLALPDVIEYPPAELNAAADEIEGGKCDVLAEHHIDYFVMRDQTRAAQKGLK